ncbi:MAG: hypothetical protein MK434_04230 [SAR324 cluster bacterium]|nr:hypothetical protein [SAR324 cluster bacterium]
MFKTEPVPEEVNKVISASGKTRFSSLKIGVVNTKSPNALKRIIRILFGLTNSSFSNKLSFHGVCIVPYSNIFS